ncbi:pyruvate formate-lyase 1-activating enzyme, partial [Aquitalea sp. S1-19]|nr:pyruvate formate-lyase 1-activating enzyme [Aquitalea sp. S1-19]
MTTPVTEIPVNFVAERTEVKGFIHSLETGAAVDGPGVRFVFFTSGCQ